jgi:hypothetical protein
VLDGVFLLSGSVFEAKHDLMEFVRYRDVGFSIACNEGVWEDGL